MRSVQLGVFFCIWVRWGRCIRDSAVVGPAGEVQILKDQVIVTRLELARQDVSVLHDVVGERHGQGAVCR